MRSMTETDTHPCKPVTSVQFRYENVGTGGSVFSCTCWVSQGCTWTFFLRGVLHMRIMPEWWGTWCRSARKRRTVLLRADRNPEWQESRKVFLHSSSWAPQWNARNFHMKLVWSFVTIAKEQVSVAISRSVQNVLPLSFLWIIPQNINRFKLKLHILNIIEYKLNIIEIIFKLNIIEI